MTKYFSKDTQEECSEGASNSIRLPDAVIAQDGSSLYYLIEDNAMREMTENEISVFNS